MNEQAKGVLTAVRQREADAQVEAAAQAMGLSPLAARVAAGRISHSRLNGNAVADVLTPSLSLVCPPAEFPDIDRAAARLLNAVETGEVVGLVCDHDMDGTASAAILTEGLRLLGHPSSRTALFVSHRLTEGYGLCAQVADRILAHAPCPTLIVTADCGTSDAERIRRLGESGIETIVTDHHDVGNQELVACVHAFVNPKRADAPGGDPATAGCGVAWALVAHALRLSGRPDAERRAELAALLDFAAVGTIADCVDLSSASNRALIRHGLACIQRAERPCWKVARAWFRAKDPNAVHSEDIAFQLAPRIASAGRLDESAPGVSFLLAKNEEEAQHWGAMLDTGNRARRALQATLIEAAQWDAEWQVEAGLPVIVVALDDGHAGVQGLVASHLVEQYSRPAIVASPRPGETGTWTASARGGGKANMHGLLGAIAARMGQTLMPSFGGHPAAGGCRFEVAGGTSHEDFFTQVREAAREAYPAHTMIEQVGERILLHDGQLDGDAKALLRLAQELETLEPFGQGFDTPQFRISLALGAVKQLGSDQHSLIDARTPAGAEVKLLAFGVDFNSAKALAAGGETRKLLVRITVDRFRAPCPTLILEHVC